MTLDHFFEPRRADELERNVSARLAECGSALRQRTEYLVLLLEHVEKYAPEMLEDGELDELREWWSTYRKVML